ncbi:unnamed protein product [Rhodiola kirilowii]
MVYLCDKGSGSADMRMRRCTSESDTQLIKKTCVDCGTSKTPLWRSGPAGPKSLCNACGIKSRKRRKPSGSVSKENKKPKNEIAVSSKSSDKDESKSSEKHERKCSDKDESKSSEKHESKCSDKDESKSSEKHENKCSDKDEMQNMIARVKMVLNGDAPSGTSNDEGDSSGCDFSEEERAAILLMALSYSNR